MTNVERKFMLITTYISNCEKKMLSEQDFSNYELMMLIVSEVEKDPNVRSILAYNKYTGEVLVDERINAS